MTRPTCTTGDSPLIRAPSAWVTDTVAMVIVGSLPPSPGGGLAVVLLAMITALAPAACAFAALSTKVQAPRSMIAILPAIAAGLSSAVQPLAGDATTTLPAKLVGEIGRASCRERVCQSV